MLHRKSIVSFCILILFYFFQRFNILWNSWFCLIQLCLYFPVELFSATTWFFFFVLKINLFIVEELRLVHGINIWSRLSTLISWYILDGRPKSFWKVVFFSLFVYDECWCVSYFWWSMMSTNFNCLTILPLKSFLLNS